MKLCILFTGGKDSVMTLWRAKKEHEVTVLLSMIPESDESYMYHVPNIRLTEHAAEALGIPIVIEETSGRPPQENADLLEALKRIKGEYGIECVAAGAVRSNYQMGIVSDICRRLGLATYTPYWQKDHGELIKEAIDAGFEIIITGVAAAGLDDSWLGRKLDHKALGELIALGKRYGLDVGGEGGEYETLVVDGPVYERRIDITEAVKKWDGVRGELTAKKVRLAPKGEA